MKRSALSTLLLLPALAATAQTPPVVTSLDANSRTWSYINYVTNANGTVQGYSRPAYIELATGMNYFDSGAWRASVPEFALVPGKAIASKGQHKVSLDANLNTSGAVQIMFPNGAVQSSHVLCLAYYDYATGSNVVVATVKDSIGQLTRPNEVIYTNAFDVVLADVRYTYTVDGFEQDIILREVPPPPDELGLNTATTTLQVLTEFPVTPTPRVTDRENRGHDIDFGAMYLGHGKAFGLHNGSREAYVNKGWGNLNGRNFLIEEIPYTILLQDAQDLHASVPSQSKALQASTTRKLPQMAGTQAREGSFLVAQVSEAPGYVIDYKTINTSTNCTFTNGYTYLISGNVSGTFNFEGGAVIKFTNNATLYPSATSTFGTNINSQTIFTSMHDNSVGDNITGSSGNPSYNNANRALMFYTNATISNARFRYLSNAIACDSANANLLLKHVQIVKCAAAIDDFYGRIITLQNCLLAENNKLFTSTPHSTMATNISACNVTFAYNTNFMDYGSPTINLTNSIVVGTYPYITSSDSVTLGTTFTSGGAGYYYTISSDKDNGTSSVDPSLLADLRTMTTYPPQTLSGTIMSNLTLSVQAMRDTNTVDRGYHYPAIDYILNQVTITNGKSVIIAAGTVLGYVFGLGSLINKDASTLVVEGTPTAHVRFLQYNAVQEQGTKLGNTATTALNTLVISPNRTTAALASLRFAEIANTPGALNMLLNQNDLFNPLTVRDCEFGRGVFYISSSADTGTNTVFNNLFRSTAVTFVYGVNSIRNNLFHGCPTLDIGNYGNNVWPVQDNMFYGCTPAVRFTDVVTMDHNLTNSTFAFTNGPLGAYYHVSTNSLNAGSRLASGAGLYHYTTQTSQGKEAGSQVDIGYHYVAVNGSGQPIDSDGDGLADYWEDSNGNGVYDSATDLANWQVADTDGDGFADGLEITLGRNPKVATTLDGSGTIQLLIFTHPMGEMPVAQ
jgi:hypothetical protein